MDSPMSISANAAAAAAAKAVAAASVNPEHPPALQVSPKKVHASSLLDESTRALPMTEQPHLRGTVPLHPEFPGVMPLRCGLPIMC